MRSLEFNKTQKSTEKLIVAAARGVAYGVGRGIPNATGLGDASHRFTEERDIAKNMGKIRRAAWASLGFAAGGGFAFLFPSTSKALNYAENTRERLLFGVSGAVLDASTYLAYALTLGKSGFNPESLAMFRLASNFVEGAMTDLAGHLRYRRGNNGRYTNRVTV